MTYSGVANERKASASPASAAAIHALDRASTIRSVAPRLSSGLAAGSALHAAWGASIARNKRAIERAMANPLCQSTAAFADLRRPSAGGRVIGSSARCDAPASDSSGARRPDYKGGRRSVLQRVPIRCVPDLGPKTVAHRSDIAGCAGIRAGMPLLDSVLPHCRLPEAKLTMYDYRAP